MIYILAWLEIFLFWIFQQNNWIDQFSKLGFFFLGILSSILSFVVLSRNLRRNNVSVSYAEYRPANRRVLTYTHLTSVLCVLLCFVAVGFAPSNQYCQQMKKSKFTNYFPHQLHSNYLNLHKIHVNLFVYMKI